MSTPPTTCRRGLFWVIGGVIVLAFLLLMAVFRSVVIPVKAAVMNLLSVGAAYGVIVAVFQWGWGGSIIGIGSTGPIDPWIPLMMFTILFGLSMDYEVFLLSRIREEWRRTGDNATAVADGLAKTARVITAAAAIMICVFGSFVIGDPLRVLKVFGLGPGRVDRDRRQPGADGAGAVGHGAARPGQLVHAPVARPDRARPSASRSTSTPTCQHRCRASRRWPGRDRPGHGETAGPTGPPAGRRRRRASRWASPPVAIPARRSQASRAPRSLGAHPPSCRRCPRRTRGPPG